MSSSDSDSSVELIFDSGASHTFPSELKKKSTDSTTATKKSTSPVLGSSSGSGSLPSALTHYRCVKFDALSEIELVIRKWHSRSPAARAQAPSPYGHPESSPEELDLAETLASLRANLPPIGTVYFTLLTGRVESFGIQLVPNRLYTIHFGARFVAQTFHGCELCFMIRNPDASFDIHAKYIDPPSYRPKNLPPGMPTPVHTTVKEMQFVSLAHPGFTSYDLKSESVDLSALMPLIRLDSRISPTGDVQRQMVDSLRIVHSSGSDERWRLACNVKQFGKRVPGVQKPPNWIYQSYVHLAQELNRQRKDAAKANRQGPNVIIVGPCDAGKSTLGKILVNYAVNEHWSPMFVDLDVGQGSIGVPGVIGAGIVDNHCQLDQEYNFRTGYPLMVHFGGITPDSDKAIHLFSVNCLVRQILYSLRTEEEQEKVSSKQACVGSSKLPQNMNPATLAEKLSSAKRSQELRASSPMPSNINKQQKRQLTKWSGLVINTHGWIFDYGYESTLDAIRKFGVSNVLVLGDYRLYERVHKDLLGYDVARAGGPNMGPNRSSYGHAQSSSNAIWNVTPISGMKVLFFQRNFSAVKRHSKLRRRMRMDRFARFFEPSMYSQSIVTIPFAHHPIFRFYSAENFSRFLREAAQSDSANQQPFQERNGNNWPPINPKSVQPHSYWTYKVEKMASRDRCGPNYDQVVFYHLNRETLVYLMNRVLTIMAVSIEQLLSHDQSWLSLRQLLAANGFARVVQIDLEKECLDVELPEALAPALRNGELVLLEIETVGPRRSK